MRKIIIDTDPGHDDALAVLSIMARPELFELLGIVTVAGNHTLDRVTRNALIISELAHSEVPVIMGSAAPLKGRLETAAHIHGGSGMDGHHRPEPKASPLDQDMVSFYRTSLLASPEKITILALAPLTNLARLFQAAPEVKERIKEISLMGGGIDGGNASAAAEFNFYADPEAADIVLSSGVPITMAGLNLTNTAKIYPREWEPLHELGMVSRFVADLMDTSLNMRDPRVEGLSMHDACAAFWLIHPELFTFRNYHVAVETQGSLCRGMSLADRRPFSKAEQNVRVLEKIDREAFVAAMISGFRDLDKRILNGV